jgi:hypothetical protein
MAPPATAAAPVRRAATPPLDPDLDAAARTAAASVVDARLQLEVAEAAHRAAVRKLVAAGGAVSEIASALGLRQQDVLALLGEVVAERRSKALASGRRVSCSFCDRPGEVAGTLIAGGGAYCCTACVGAAREALHHDPRLRCSFCGNRGADAIATAASGAAHVCSDCLGRFDQLLLDGDAHR